MYITPFFGFIFCFSSLQLCNFCIDQQAAQVHNNILSLQLIFLILCTMTYLFLIKKFKSKILSTLMEKLLQIDTTVKNVIYGETTTCGNVKVKIVLVYNSLTATQQFVNHFQ
jgi:hypothetical protein